MATILTISGSLKFEIDGVTIANGSHSAAASQTGASGTNSAQSIVLGDTAAPLPLGECDPEGATGVYVWVRNMSADEDAILEDDGSHTIGLVRAGKLAGPWLVTFAIAGRARVEGDTPRLQVIAVQE